MCRLACITGQLCQTDSRLVLESYAGADPAFLKEGGSGRALMVRSIQCIKGDLGTYPTPENFGKCGTKGGVSGPPGDPPLEPPLLCMWAGQNHHHSRTVIANNWPQKMNREYIWFNVILCYSVKATKSHPNMFVRNGIWTRDPSVQKLSKHARLITINGKDFLDMLDLRCSVLIFGDDMVSSVQQRSQ